MRFYTGIAGILCLVASWFADTEVWSAAAVVASTVWMVGSLIVGKIEDVNKKEKSKSEA